MARSGRRRARLAANPYRRVAQALHEHPDWLPVITEGDSWFAFPGLLWRRNVIGHLQRSFDARMAMLLMSHNGDSVAQILSGRQKRRLRYALQHRFGFRMLLFSAGGNDIVDALPRLLRPKRPGRSWRECIDEEVLGQTLHEIRDAYRSLLRMRDRHNPDCHVFAHTYDFPTVNGEPVRLLGKPVRPAPLTQAFRARGIEANADRRRIVREVMSRFHTMLDALQLNAINPFTVVDTRGILHPAHWQDEMHPTDRGFGLVAQRFGQAIVRYFPGAIPATRLRQF